MLNIIGKRYIFFVISFFLIVPGLVVFIVDVATNKLPLSIDFTGGSFAEFRIKSDRQILPADLIKVYNSLNISDVQVQTTNQGTFVIRSSYLDEQVRLNVISTIEKETSGTVEVLRFDSVGPTIGKEVTSRATSAVLVSTIIVATFIGFAFRGVANAFRYGICAVIALIHDIGIVLSVTAIGGHFFGWQFDALIFTALLTVIGFSMQDTIVVFDRIRENSNIFRRLDFESLVNHSVVQTLQRSINTQLMTVEFMLLALALFGGVTLRNFAIVMLAGLISGTYSSIFVASAVLVVWEKKEWRTWFRRSSEVSA